MKSLKPILGMSFYAALCVAFGLAIQSCSTTSEYYKGCVDGVTGLKFQFRTEALGEKDIAEYYCKVVERNRNKEVTPHK
jgi:hypothetical protein